MSYAAIVVGVGSIAAGAIKESNASANAKRLAASRPKIGRDTIADENLALTQSDLAKGMSSRSEAAYENASDKQFSSSLAALQKGGGSVNSIGDIYGDNEEGRQRLSMLNDNLRLKQIQDVIEASKPVQTREKEMLQFNKFAPWADEAQANAAARQSAESQIWSGVNTAAGAYINNAAGNRQEKMYDKYFGNNQPQSPQGQQPQAPVVNYNYPTYNTAQPNPTSFNSVANNNLWSTPGDINGNRPYTPTPIQQQQPNNTNPNYNPWENFDYGFFNTIKRI